MEAIYYSEQEEILKKAYLTCSDIQRLVPISTKESYKLMKEIGNEMESLGIPRFATRKKMVPTSMVVEKLKLAELKGRIR